MMSDAVCDSPEQPDQHDDPDISISEPLEGLNDAGGGDDIDDGSRNETRLRFLPLVMIIFYTVSGGPFGIEESVRSGGFFVALMGFIIMPLIWSVPEGMLWWLILLLLLFFLAQLTS